MALSSNRRWAPVKSSMQHIRPSPSPNPPQLFPGRSITRIDTSYRLPECLGVVHFNEMRQLVRHDGEIGDRPRFPLPLFICRIYQRFA